MTFGQQHTARANIAKAVVIIVATIDSIDECGVDASELVAFIEMLGEFDRVISDSQPD